MKVKNLVTFSKRLREARVIKGLTQLQMAQQIAVSIQSVRMWENGTSSLTGVNLTKLSDLLGVSEEYLAGYDDEVVVTEGITSGSSVSGDCSTLNLDGLKAYVSRLMDNNNLSGKKRIVVGHALAIIETALKE